VSAEITGLPCSTRLTLSTILGILQVINQKLVVGRARLRVGLMFNVSDNAYICIKNGS